MVLSCNYYIFPANPLDRLVGYAKNAEVHEEWRQGVLELSRTGKIALARK